MEKYVELEKKFGGQFRETSMLDSDYKDKKVYWLEFAGAACPICGHKSWCMINVSGTKVICMRIANNHKLSNNNGYLYLLGNKYKVSFDVKAIKPVLTYPRAQDSVLDFFYRSVLFGCPLRKNHRQDLYNRGLDDTMINIHNGRGFGSYYQLDPSVKDNGVKRLEPLFRQIDVSNNIVNNVWINLLDNMSKITHSNYYRHTLWHGVPGFFKFGLHAPRTSKNIPALLNLPIFSVPADGLLVPYYNELNELVAFQVRVDHVSASVTVSKTLPCGDLKVYFNSHTKQYTVNLKPEGAKVRTIASGIAQKDIIDLEYSNMPYQLRVEHGGKYFWVSSAKENGGARGKMPIQVAYNPDIASLDPTKVDKDGNLSERKIIQNYIKQPKSIWLTEGGLKAYIVSMYLPKRFKKEDLDLLGKDVLGVAGVNGYRNFLPMLKRLHVNTVTTAYDMDFQKNKQVKENYRSLISLLKENGYKIRIANWDGSKAKGIDDALVQQLEISFTNVN